MKELHDSPNALYVHGLVSVRSSEEIVFRIANPRPYTEPHYLWVKEDELLIEDPPTKVLIPGPPGIPDEEWVAARLLVERVRWMFAGAPEVCRYAGEEARRTGAAPYFFRVHREAVLRRDGSRVTPNQVEERETAGPRGK